MVPTSKHHCPCPRSYTCSWVPASRGPTLGSPWLPRILNVRLDTASDPGEYRRRSPLRNAGCCLPAGQNRRHSPTKIFGAQHLQGRHHPLPLHLACASADASTRPLPATPQGSILGSRLTMTQAGLSPARTRGLARPQPLFRLTPFPLFLGLFPERKRLQQFLGAARGDAIIGLDKALLNIEIQPHRCMLKRSHLFQSSEDRVLNLTDGPRR